MRKSVFAAFLFSVFLLPTGALAQDEGNKAKEAAGNSGIYLKFGGTFTKGEVSGFDIKVNGVTLEVEGYFKKTHLLFLSGWTAGYRKEFGEVKEVGHFLHAEVFREFKLGHRLNIVARGGVEWGRPSGCYYKTRQFYRDGEPYSYEHIFLKHNSTFPGLKPRTDNATLYPVAELSFTRRSGWILIDGGTRFSFYKFGIDEFILGSGGITGFRQSDKLKIMPLFFVRIGLGS